MPSLSLLSHRAAAGAGAMCAAAAALALSAFMSIASAEPALNWGAANTAPSALGTSTRSALQAPLANGSASTPRSLPGAPPNRATSTTSAAQKTAQGLFALDANTPIVANGKKTTAGALQGALRAALVAKAGPPKTFKSSARRIDPALLAAAAPGAPKALPTRGFFEGNIGAKIAQATETSVATDAPRNPRAGTVQLSAAERTSTSTQSTLAALNCTDHGPPKILEVSGRLQAGGKVSVYGQCFGARAGRVEIIGPFAGGKLVPAFTSWDMTGIEVQIPADIRGVPDTVVAVSVITADGKATPAAQAKFIAAREQVEVPAALWTPGANFESAATTDGNPVVFTSAPVVNPAAAGHLQRSMRINPQCALTTMSVDVLSGSVTQIRGWEQGLPYEATATIDWTGTCIDTTTTTTYNYVVTQSRDVSISTACRVALEPRAWAMCPAGISP